MRYEYELTLKSYDKIESKTSYTNLMETVMIMGNILNSMNLIELLTEGTYIETYTPSLKSKKFKRYVIKNEIPNLEIILFKKSKGNLDMNLLETYLFKVRGLYERNNN